MRYFIILVIFRAQKEDSFVKDDYTIPDKLRKIFKFIDFMKSHLNVEESVGEENWTDVEFVVCHSKKRIPGLATELVGMGVRILKERGVKVYS